MQCRLLFDPQAQKQHQPLLCWQRLALVPLQSLLPPSPPSCCLSPSLGPMLFRSWEAGGRQDNDSTILMCPSHSATVLRWLTSSCCTIERHGEGPAWLEKAFCEQKSKSREQEVLPGAWEPPSASAQSHSWPVYSISMYQGTEPGRRTDDVCVESTFRRQSQEVSNYINGKSQLI